jgi:DNA polymerase-3 subunit epsilon
MAREIILDTETTGLDPRDHRVIEIACVEVEDFIPTGRPSTATSTPTGTSSGGRAGARHLQRHSWPTSRASPTGDLRPLPEFVGDAVIVAHNAPSTAASSTRSCARGRAGEIPDHRWVCTYQLAQKRFPACTTRWTRSVSVPLLAVRDAKAQRALIDATLLAAVYLERTAGPRAW